VRDALKIVTLVSLAALALAGTAQASSSVTGTKKHAIIAAVAKRDRLVLTQTQTRACFRTRGYRTWAANTATPLSPKHARLFAPSGLCGIKGRYHGQLEAWQPDTAILHVVNGAWRFIWEFDEATAAEARQHAIPTSIFNRLVNRQLFHAGAAPGDASLESQRPCAQIYWRTFDDRDKRCPAHLHVIADLDYWHLQWSRWTRDGATSHGVEVQFDDAGPAHAPASIVQAVKLELSRARRCNDGRRIYTRLTATLYAAKRYIKLQAPVPKMPATGRTMGRPAHVSYTCHPRLGG
jgi:hypothetical protein